MAHTYKYEGGGGAVLGSIQPQPLDFEPDGTLDLQKVSHFVKPDDYHFAKTRLLCLENTHHGLALPIDYLSEAKSFAESYRLRLHLDGARVFNAAVKCRVEVSEISQYFDSVSVCLSKGLGAPVGSVLCGDHDTIAKARRWRKMLGGGMRQAGILAAAGIFALKNNSVRLEEDHQKAQLLADELGKIEQLRVDYAEAQTNMVFVTLPEDAAELKAYLEEFGVLIPSGQRVRLVLHLDISKEGVSRVVSCIKKYFTG